MKKTTRKGERRGVTLQSLNKVSGDHRVCCAGRGKSGEGEQRVQKMKRSKESNKKAGGARGKKIS